MFGNQDVGASESIPNVLMEEDDEEEIIVKRQIIEPILHDLVNKIHNDLKLKHLEANNIHGNPLMTAHLNQFFRNKN